MQSNLSNSTNSIESEDYLQCTIPQKMRRVDWRWAAAKGFLNKETNKWNEEMGGQEAYLKQRNDRMMARSVPVERNVTDRQREIAVLLSEDDSEGGVVEEHLCAKKILPFTLVFSPTRFPGEKNRSALQTSIKYRTCTSRSPLPATPTPSLLPACPHLRPQPPRPAIRRPHRQQRIPASRAQARGLSNRRC
jgi:hypothetical protein